MGVVVKPSITEAVEDAIEIVETDEPKAEPKSNDEVEYLIRRVSEEVTKSLSGLFPKSKAEPEDEAEPDDSEDSPAKRKRRKTVTPTPVKSSFFSRLKFPSKGRK